MDLVRKQDDQGLRLLHEMDGKDRPVDSLVLGAVHGESS